ncbi:hypothetical protein [Pontitalea aquivivens]|uniref:hypothetical protein n=1 Tax=Pontitalea aquivivens TaxID=3388663 RepID=UPI0039705882
MLAVIRGMAGGLRALVAARAAALGRRLVLGALGGGMVLVGLGFLTAAVWFALRAVMSPVQVALILGLAYGGLGLVLLALARHRPTRAPVPPAAAATTGATAGAAAGDAAGDAAGFQAGLDAALGGTARDLMRDQGPVPALLGAFLIGLDLALVLRRPRKD